MSRCCIENESNFGEIVSKNGHLKAHAAAEPFSFNCVLVRADNCNGWSRQKGASVHFSGALGYGYGVGAICTRATRFVILEEEVLNFITGTFVPSHGGKYFADSSIMYAAWNASSSPFVAKIKSFANPLQ